MSQANILLITSPAQGHLNPTLQLAKHLLRTGARVTFATALFAHRRMTATGKFPEGVSFAVYSDGYDDGFNSDHDDLEHFASESRRRAEQFLNDLFVKSRDGGAQFDCLIYTMLFPWAVEVADTFNIPSTLLWIQSSAVFGIYHYYFNGYGDHIRNNGKDPSFSLNLPGLPSMAFCDLPSLIGPSNAYPVFLTTIQDLFERLWQGTNKKVLVNTFDALETEPLKSVPGFELIGVGPLLPSAVLNGDDASDTTFGGDLFKDSKDYLNWLDSRAESSVVYVSFGTLAVLKDDQVDELAKGLIGSGFEFLWVMRDDGGKDTRKIFGNREELDRRGMIVPWCSQVEVLSHPAVGCFVTHCGWNSTLESLSTGKPVVAFPQWTDQTTDAKFLEDVWRTGVRVRDNGKGVVESGEIERCLQAVMVGETTREIKENAEKWKGLAREAVARGGSSDLNLRGFIQQVGKSRNLSDKEKVLSF